MDTYSAFEVVCYFEEAIAEELKKNRALAFAIRFGHHMKHEHWKKYVDAMVLKGEKTQNVEDSKSFVEDLELLTKAGLLKRN